MVLSRILFLLVAACAIAQDFGAFVLQSHLTSYDNTLLDATNFVLAPAGTDIIAPPASSVPSPTEASLSEVALTLTSTSTSSSSLVVALPSASTSPRIPLLASSTSVTAGLSSNSLSSSDKTTTPRATTAESVLSTLLSIAAPANSAALDCAQLGAIARVTSVATETIVSTVSTLVHVNLTRRVFVNESHTALHSPSPLAAVPEDTLTHTSTYTTCVSASASALPASLPSLSVLSPLASSVPPSLPATAVQPSSLTPLNGSACGGSVVTKTVYQLPSLASFFTTRFDGTDVLILDLPRSTCSSPAWPFYENPQWSSLPTNTPGTNLAPKRQQVPPSVMKAYYASSLVRRAGAWQVPQLSLTVDTNALSAVARAPTSTTHLRETVVAVTTTCSSTITSFPIATARSSEIPIVVVSSVTAVVNELFPPLQQSVATDPIGDGNNFISSLLQSIFGGGSALSTSTASLTAPEVTITATTAVPVTATITATATATATATETATATTTATATATITASATTTTTATAITTAIATESVTPGTSIYTASATAVWGQPAPAAGASTQPSALTQANRTSEAGSSGTTGTETVPIAQTQGASDVSSTTLTSSITGSSLAPPSPILSLATQTLVVASLVSATSVSSTQAVPSSGTAAGEGTNQSDSTTAFTALPSLPAPAKTGTPTYSVGPASSASSAVGSVATYDCAAWSSGDRVLVCHINGQVCLAASLSTRMLVAALALAALLVLV